MTAVYDGRLHGLRLHVLSPAQVGRVALRRRLCGALRAPALWAVGALAWALVWWSRRAR